MQNVDVNTDQNEQVPYPNIPPILESKESDYLSSLVVATLLAVGGWYGGELSFRHKIGVIGTDRSS